LGIADGTDSLKYGWDGQLEKTVGVDSWEKHLVLIAGLAAGQHELIQSKEP
jgi:hypothetical protein